MTQPSLGVQALHDMRTHRRRHRLADLDWFETLYRVYLAAFLGGGAILWASGWVGDEPLSASAVDALHRHTPHVVGLVAAVIVFLGARSGANGGPLSVEPAEVTHVMLAPVDRHSVLRRPAIQRLRTLSFAGALIGATANQLLGRRVPDHPSLVLWALYGALTGALIGSLFVTAAVLAHGLRLPRWAVTAVSGALLIWQAAVTVADTSIAGPFDTLGSLSLWWSRVAVIDLVGVAVVLGLTAASVLLLNSFSLEALVRRSALVTQLRFAVTMQDLRTVILLRRSLSHEYMRRRPWVRVPRALRRNVVIGRGLQSFAHFPARRLLRMALVASAGSAALVGAYRGTTPLVVAAGIAMFVLGLDLIEPLSQEVDQPDRTDALPVARGELLVQHLVAPAVAVIPMVVIGVAVAVAFEPSTTTLLVGLPLGLGAALAGVAGAVVNAVRGAPDPVGGANEGLYLPPEVSGMGTVVRAIWPPVIATFGCLPIVLVREAEGPLAAPVLRGILGVAIIVGLVAGWVQQRDAIRAWFRNAQNASRTTRLGSE